MKHFLWFVLKIGKWLTAKTENNVWQCFFCKQLFDGDKPKINAYVNSVAIYQCDGCRIEDLERTPTPITKP